MKNTISSSNPVCAAYRFTLLQTINICQKQFKKWLLITTYLGGGLLNKSSVV